MRIEIIELKVKDKSSALKEIANQAKQLDLVSSSTKLNQALVKRENEFSTGFEEGIAIPHARINEIKKTAILVAKLTKPVDWKALDGKLTNLAITLLVPSTTQGNSEHLDLLAKISNMLMDKSFRAKLKASSNQQIITLLNEVISKKANPKTLQPIKRPKLNIVGATACPTGVAHTFMVANALIAEGQKRGHHVKIEKHGANGLEGAITSQEIAKADVAILALGRDIELAKFANLPQEHVEIAKALKDIPAIFDQLEQIAWAAKTQNKKLAKTSTPKAKSRFGYDKKIAEAKNNKEKIKWGTLRELSRMKKAIFTGLSYIIPLIAGTGILMAIGEIIFNATHPHVGEILENDLDLGGIIGIVKAGTSYGPWTGITFGAFINDWSSVDFGQTIYAMGRFGIAYFLIPILAAYVAYGLAGKPAIAAGLIVGTLGGTMMNGGFIGGLIGGLMAGYGTLLCTKVFAFKNNTLITLNAFLLTPVVSILVVGLIYRYSIGMGISALMSALLTGLTQLNDSSVEWIVAFIIGMMVCVDYGGPIGKTAVLFVMPLIGQAAPEGASAAEALAWEHDKFLPLTYLYTALSVPMLAMFLTWILNRKHFSADGKAGAITNGVLSIFNISENIIPFALAAPLVVIPASLIGGGMASLIISQCDVIFKTPFGYFLSTPILIGYGDWRGIGYVTLAFFSGVAINTFLNSVLLRVEAIRKFHKTGKKEKLFFPTGSFKLVV